MKQIIVNVAGLTIEEKQRVNEALAKITGFNKMTSDLFMANWIYAPSTYKDDQITYSGGNKSYENKEPTHTPQEVLEMAGMENEIKFVYESVGSVSRITMSGFPSADHAAEALRKLCEAFNQLEHPKTHIVNGVEVPDLRFVPKKGDRYYLVDPTEPEFTFNYAASSGGVDSVWVERGLCYEYTEAGKQAAILHAKVWLGIA